MAIADYFHKNAMAASQVLQHFENAGFESLLARQCIGLAIDGEGAASKEGAAAADMAVRLLSRFYPKMAIVAVDRKAVDAAKDLAKLAKEINPKIALADTLAKATHCLAIGETQISLTRKGAQVYYIGSQGWTALLSADKPVGSGNSSNPFGAGASACFGVANIFRIVFEKQLPADAVPSRKLKFSVLECKSGTAARAPALTTVPLGEAGLVGAGAMGNGFLWALRRTRVTGSLTVIDPQKLELSNLQRYVSTTRQDEFSPKVTLAERWFTGVKGFSVSPQEMTWDEYAHKSEWKFDRVAVALDSAKDRIAVQASLPRWIANAWTLGSSIGVSRHPTLEGDACLACLYLPDNVDASEDYLIAQSLGLPTIPQHPDLMDVRRRLDLNVPNDRAYLERIAPIKNVPIEQLLPFENKTLRALYTEGVCGGQVLGLVVNGHETHAEVPLAFQSALAGLVLAAELVADACEARASALPTISRLDLLKPLPDYISSRRAKDTNNRCLCQDDDFKACYHEKYG